LPHLAIADLHFLAGFKGEGSLTAACGLDLYGVLISGHETLSALRIVGYFKGVLALRRYNHCGCLDI